MKKYIKIIGKIMLKIAEILPNPIGKDEEKETITLINTGTKTEKLDNYIMRYEYKSSKKQKRISAREVQPGQKVEIYTKNYDISLKNTEGKVVLLTIDGKVVDFLSYSSAKSGISIKKAQKTDTITQHTQATIEDSLLKQVILTEKQEIQASPTQLITYTPPKLTKVQQSPIAWWIIALLLLICIIIAILLTKFKNIAIK